MPWEVLLGTGHTGQGPSPALLEHPWLCRCALHAAESPSAGLWGHSGVQKAISWLGEKPQLGRAHQHQLTAQPSARQNPSCPNPRLAGAGARSRLTAWARQEFLLPGAASPFYEAVNTQRAKILHAGRVLWCTSHLGPGVLGTHWHSWAHSWAGCPLWWVEATTPRSTPGATAWCPVSPMVVCSHQAQIYSHYWDFGAL